jgi:hypothetical protein
VAGAAFFILGMASVPLLAAELATHYYQPRLLALMHAIGLGWITMAIMGASYQLLPIVLERSVWSERLAAWQFVVFVAGVVGMVGCFGLAAWNGLPWAAGVVGVGVALHVTNVGLSVRRPVGWTFTVRSVVLALAGLGLTGLFGLGLAASRVWGLGPADRLTLLHAHFHLALLGWIAPMVLGVAARVYPMFLLAPEPGRAIRLLQLWGLGLGMPLVVAGLLGAPVLVVPGAVTAAAAVLAHAVWVVDVVRRRRRPALDWGLRFVLTGAAFLVVATGLGLGLATGRLSGPRLALAYAVLVLGGWVSLTIVGMLLKIVPFLVWYRVYGPRVGREPVPLLAQLSWSALERITFALLAGGLAGIAAAIAAGAAVWIEVAGVVLAAGAGGLGATLGRILAHLGRRASAGPGPWPSPAGAR